MHEQKILYKSTSKRFYTNPQAKDCLQIHKQKIAHNSFELNNCMISRQKKYSSQYTDTWGGPISIEAALSRLLVSELTNFKFLRTPSHIKTEYQD